MRPITRVSRRSVLCPRGTTSVTENFKFQRLASHNRTRLSQTNVNMFGWTCSVWPAILVLGQLSQRGQNRSGQNRKGQKRIIGTLDTIHPSFETVVWCMYASLQALPPSFGLVSKAGRYRDKARRLSRSGRLLTVGTLLVTRAVIIVILPTVNIHVVPKETTGAAARGSLDSTCCLSRCCKSVGFFLRCLTR